MCGTLAGLLVAGVVRGARVGVRVAVVVAGLVAVGLGDCDMGAAGVLDAALLLLAGACCAALWTPVGPHAASATTAATPVRTFTTACMRVMPGTLGSVRHPPPPEAPRLRRVPPAA